MPFDFDTNSRRHIASVSERLQKLCYAAAELTDHPFAIVQGNRTQAEQDKIYAQGRHGNPGHIVTWTRHSKHIGGHAVDFAALDEHGKIDWTDSKFPPIAKLFRIASDQTGIGMEWGGEWRNKDWGHVQLNSLRDSKMKDPPVA